MTAMSVSRATAKSPREPARLMMVQPIDAGLGPDAIAFPTERALLLRVAIPLPSHRQRQAAAGYAVEDLIADPFEACHITLGPRLGPDEYLVVVVRRTEMEKWVAAGGERGRLVPDVLALPTPMEGCLSIREAAGRVMARRADGTGFATLAQNLERLWRAEGAPRILLHGGTLPQGLDAVAEESVPMGPSADALGIDLFQGAFARQGGRGTLLRRIGIVAATALLAQGAILSLDVFALDRIATQRETDLRAELSTRVPDLPPATPLDVAMRAALPRAAATGGGFLPLMVTVAEALRPVSDEISLRDLRFGAADGTLALTVEGRDLETLQRVEAALTARGLSVASGVATTANGGAEVSYAIRGGNGA